MPTPIVISIVVGGTLKQLVFGANENTPYPTIVSYKQTKKGTVKDILGLGQFGGIGQQIEYASTKWDLALLREYIRIAGEVRGQGNAEAIKALFNYNVSRITLLQQFAGPLPLPIIMRFKSDLKMNLPFLGKTVDAFVERLTVDAISGTNRYKYDIQFISITQQNPFTLPTIRPPVR